VIAPSGEVEGDGEGSDRAQITVETSSFSAMNQ
jgi:hypothetical protein